MTVWLDQQTQGAMYVCRRCRAARIPFQWPAGPERASIYSSAWLRELALMGPGMPGYHRVLAHTTERVCAFGAEGVAATPMAPWSDAGRQFWCECGRIIAERQDPTDTFHIGAYEIRPVTVHRLNQEALSP